MKTTLILGLLAIFLLSSNIDGRRFSFRGSRFRGRGRFLGRLRVPSCNVTYTIRNMLTDPTFEFTEMFTFRAFRPPSFLNIMKTAANRNSSFRFSVDFMNIASGFRVTAINQLAENQADGTFWQLIQAPDQVISAGVNRFAPFCGDTITFEFTSTS